MSKLFPYGARSSTGEVDFTTELDFKIKYVFHPAEPMTMEYPGSPAEIDIIDMKLGGKAISEDMFNLIMSDHEDEIKEVCGEHHDAYKDEHRNIMHSRPIRRKIK